MRAAVSTEDSVEERSVSPRNSHGSSIADRLYGFIEGHEIAIFLCLLGYTLVFSLLRSHHKLFWYDEIFTIIVSSQPDLRHFVAAMPPEGNPPLNTFLTRLVIGAFGISQIAARLVPLFGFLFALAGVYLFVRREAGKVLGILAVVLTIAGPVWQYSYEARPYGILMGFFMLALLSWQEATRIGDEESNGSSRVLSLCGLALGIVGCAFSHYIGLIEIGAPLLVGEAVRSYQRRKIDWPLLLTGLCCLPSLLLIVPMMHRTRDVVLSNSHVLSGPLSLHQIHNYFTFASISWPLVMDGRIVVFVLVVALVTWVPSASQDFKLTSYQSGNNQVRTYVLWACVVASLLIPITWLAMVFGKGWYFCRYGIGSALGVVLCLCLVLAKRNIRSSALVSGVIVICAVESLFGFEREVRAGTVPPPALKLATQGPADPSSETANLPIVLSDPLIYPTVWWYSPASVKPNVVYVEAEASKRDLASQTLMAVRSLFHGNLLEFESFTSQTPHFLMELDPNDENGQFDMRDDLKAHGFTVRPIHSWDGATLFDVSRSSPSPDSKVSQ